jgi:uncharacterized membrane protein YGL010W
VKTLEDQMSFYAAYHQDARNKLTHFIGVPAIVLGVMIALGWLRVDAGGSTVSGAMVVTALMLAYYVFLDLGLGLAMAVVFGALLFAAETIATLPFKESAAWFLLFFAGGWVIQLIGHVYEGRKPALVDNLFQIFVAPIFLCAEVFFALGYKPALHATVQKRALDMRAAAGIKEPPAPISSTSHTAR